MQTYSQYRLAALLLGACGQEDAEQPEEPAQPVPDEQRESSGEEAAAPAGDRDSAAASGPASVDDQRLVDAADEPGQWMTHGGTYLEQRFSTLDQINTDNIDQLGLAWYADLETKRGQEATPLVVDGVIYITESWSKVSAYDASPVLQPAHWTALYTRPGNQHSSHQRARYPGGQFHAGSGLDQRLRGL